MEDGRTGAGEKRGRKREKCKEGGTKTRGMTQEKGRREGERERAERGKKSRGFVRERGRESRRGQTLEPFWAELGSLEEGRLLVLYRSEEL